MSAQGYFADSNHMSCQIVLLYQNEDNISSSEAIGSNDNQCKATLLR